MRPTTSLPIHSQPLYGFLSDGFPIAGYRRRSYLAISGIMGSISWLALSSSWLVDSPAKATAVCILSSLSVAVSDVVVDSIVVERVQSAGDKDPGLAGGLQSLCWGTYRCCYHIAQRCTERFPMFCTIQEARPLVASQALIFQATFWSIFPRDRSSASRHSSLS